MALMLTRRELCIGYLAKAFQDLQHGTASPLDKSPTPYPFIYHYDHIFREPVGARYLNTQLVAALIEGREHKEPIIGQYVCHLELSLEFVLFVPKDLEIGPQVNLLLGEIQRVINFDVSCGGLSYNVVEEGNAWQSTGPTDRYVDGSVFLRIDYKHAIKDPTAYV